MSPADINGHKELNGWNKRAGTAHCNERCIIYIKCVYTHCMCFTHECTKLKVFECCRWKTEHLFSLWLQQNKNRKPCRSSWMWAGAQQAELSGPRLTLQSARLLHGCQRPLGFLGGHSSFLLEHVLQSVAHAGGHLFSIAAREQAQSFYF